MSGFSKLLSKNGDSRHTLTDAYIFLMLLVFPLFTGFEGYSAITASKFYCFLALTAAWLLGLVVMTLVRRPGFSRPAPAQVCALAFLILCCVSALCSDYGSVCLLGAGRYDGLASLAGYVLAFLGVSAFGSFRRCHAAAFGISVTLCCAVAFLQLLGKNPLWLFPEGCCYYDAHIKYTGEFLGTIGNVNLLSAMLCLSIPLFFGLFVTGEEKRRPLYLVPLFCSAFTLAASGVAGGAVGCCAAAFVALPLLVRNRARLCSALSAAAVCLLALFPALSLSGGYSGDALVIGFTPGAAAYGCLLLAAALLILRLLLPRFIKAPPERALRLALGGLSAAAVIAAVLLLWFYPGDSGTLYELSQVLHGHVEDSFGSSRILIWRAVLELIPERPLLGGGPGTLPLRLDVEFSRYVEETGQTLRSVVDNAHNEYLQLLADTGAAGLLAYLGTLLTALARGLKRESAQPLCLAVFCYCVQGFFGLGLCITAPMFWIFLGLAQNRSAAFPSGG